MTRSKGAVREGTERTPERGQLRKGPAPYPACASEMPIYAVRGLVTVDNSLHAKAGSNAGTGATLF